MTARIRKRRLGVEDIDGAWVIIPTPAKPGSDDWRQGDTVDLDETSRMVEVLIGAGIDGILSLGTFGECSTLTWDEKQSFMKTVVDTARGRVPFFAGTTSLNTRDTVQQTRAAMDLGVDGTMLGLPMWCQPDLPTAVRFYKDVAEGCPEIAICVYSNREAFKFDFPRPFWAQVSEIPQVICAKYLDIATLVADLRLTKGRIRFLPTDANYYATARVDPENCTAFWSSGANCGPSVALRLRDEVIKAKASHVWTTAKNVTDEIAATLAPLFPKGSFAEFSKYNVGLEKARIDAGGWVKAGPPRPPYHLIPDDYLAGARRSGAAWAELAARYDIDRRQNVAATRIEA